MHNKKMHAEDVSSTNGKSTLTKITSSTPDSKKYIHVTNYSTPLLLLRDNFTNAIGNKNMLDQIGKHAKKNQNIVHIQIQSSTYEVFRD